MKNKIEINVKPGNLSFIENYLSSLYGSPQVWGGNSRIVEKHYSVGILLKSTKGYSQLKNRCGTSIYANKIVIKNPQEKSSEELKKLEELATK